MSVMTRIVQLVVTDVPTVLLQIYRSAGRLAASIELVLKLSKLRTVATVFELTAASMLIKSSSNTLARLSLRMSAIDG
jgi:hypothetical protein